MQNRFRKHILSYINTDERLLIGVSGGRDSIALLDLCVKIGLNCAVAHCNFHLRDEESDEDERFVRDLAEKNGVEYFVIDFQTKKIAKKEKWSIQEAARNLRFDWFRKLLDQKKYTKILLAHHMNDQAETMLFNMVRGSGVKGLIGMRESRGDILRPLLNFTRKEIDEYIKENNLQYREDSSNLCLKYNRNLIRQEIIPNLEKVNAAALENIVGFGEKLKDYELIVARRVEELRKNFFHITADEIRIDKRLWKEEDSNPSLTYEILKDFGFVSEQIKKIHLGIFKTSGKRFESENHNLLIDRSYLFVKEREGKGKRPDVIVLESPEDKLNGFELNIKDALAYKIVPDSRLACFDLNKLEFPIVYRKWKQGDKFHPLGMKGKKLVSDLLVDLKLNLFEKENVFVFESAGKIIWVVGIRLDDRFKITSQTTRVLEVRKIND